MNRWLALGVVAGSLLVPGSLSSVSAGATATTSLSGFVFVDYDRDGRVDPGERADANLAGLTVDIVGLGAAAATTTSSDGGFEAELSGFSEPMVRVAFETPAGYQSTFAQAFGTGAPETATAIQFVDVSRRTANIAYGIVPDSSCPVDPLGVGGPSGAFPDGNPNSVSGKVWTACFVDGARTDTTGAQDVLVGANYDATGWNPSNPDTDFGGSLDVEHIGTRLQLGSVWGVAYDEWDGLLFASAVVKRHADLGVEGPDGLYWFEVGSDGTNLSGQSIGLDSLSPADAPSFGDDPPSCPLAEDGTYDYTNFSVAASARGRVWDCRDLSLSAGGERTYDWWAYDRSGRFGIGDIDVTPDGNRLLVMNATADTVFVYDITSGRPVYVRHITIDDPGCSGGVFEAWATTAIDAVEAYIGVTCTAADSGAVADLTSHVVSLDIETGEQTSVAAANYDYVHGPGWSSEPGPLAGAFQPWLAPVGTDLLPRLPPVAEAAGIVFRPSENAYAYSTGWDYHQPLLSDIEVDPFDGSLVLAVSDRWALMTGVFNCDLDPGTGGCGFEFPAPPPGDYDGQPGDDPVTGYNSGIIGYVAGDLLRMCNTTNDPDAPTYVLEGGLGCDPAPFSPSFEPPFGGGPAGTTEWYWNDQAFVSKQTENAHPEAAQGAVYIGDRRSDVVYTAMNPTDTFGAGLSWDSNSNGAHRNALQFYRTDLASRDGTGFKGASLGDVEGCSIPIEVGNSVWFDSNVNGIRDPGEPPIAGMTVDLRDTATDEVIASVISDDSGDYYFSTADGVQPNSGYAFEFSVSELTVTDDLGVSRTDLRETLVDASITDDLDSDVVGGRIVFSTKAPGQNDHTLDAGFGPKSELPDSVGLENREAPASLGSTVENPELTLRTVLFALGSIALLAVVVFFSLRWSWNRP